MTNTDFLSDEERKFYLQFIPMYMDLETDAELACELFKNPNIGANLKAASAFIEAAMSLIEYENTTRRIHDGNKNTGNTVPTSPTPQLGDLSATLQ